MARDEPPYTPAFDALVQGFQDRTFKNASHEQVFSAIIKYTRSSGNAPTPQPPGSLTDEQLKQLKALLSRHLVGGKIPPYSDEFEVARGEFSKQAGRRPVGARLLAGDYEPSMPAAAPHPQEGRRPRRRGRGRRRIARSLHRRSKTLSLSRRAWLCVPPTAACWADVGMTLAGQGTQYWAGGYAPSGNSTPSHGRCSNPTR